MSVASAKPRAKSSGWYETIKIIVQALLLAFLVRTFLFQPFNIPSGSMKDTLLVGDYLFVSKYSYGYSRYSFPWGVDLLAPFAWEPKKGEVAEVTLPGETTAKKVRVLAGPGDVVTVGGDGKAEVRSASETKSAGAEFTVPDSEYYVAKEDGSPFDYGAAFSDVLIGDADLPVHFTPIEWFARYSPRVWSGMPKRGDIVVFKLPSDNSTDYIKRVIGLPGDKIQMIGGVLHINGQPVTMEEVEVGNDREGEFIRYRETLPNGVTHFIIDRGPNPTADNTDVYEVPQGSFFMMGDNRDNSTDSRFRDVGYVPFENLIGRAEIVFFSVDERSAAWEFWKWPWTVRWDRLFNLL